MKNLINPVRDYAWGSRTALASLRGEAVPSLTPEAEMWMGAHPSAPSVVSEQDGQVPLSEVIAKDPVPVLGAAVIDRFGPRLPYLLKLLAAAEPLSLQAHPDLAQAAAGFAAEQRSGARNYNDDNHKPELLVAVDEFEGLCGFRDPLASATLLASLGVAELDPVIRALRTGPAADGLRQAVELLMTWPDQDRPNLVAAVVASGHPLAADLGRRYPGDVGVVVALLLNHIRLRPDEAAYMPAGNLHAYLSGFGVEIMAASDNVLRGGLTVKPVDVPELLRVLRYEVLEDPVVRPVAVGPGLSGWPVPVDDFQLVKAEVPGTTDIGDATVELPGGGPRIVCCLRGPAVLRSGEQTTELTPGQSVFVAATEPAVRVSGAGAVVFQSACAV